MQLSQVKRSEHETQDIDEDPEDIENVVAVGARDEGAESGAVGFRPRSESPAQEGRSQVDGDAGEPYHEGAENDALGGVHHVQRLHVLLSLRQEDRKVVEHCCEHVDGRNRDEEEERGLQQGALSHWIARVDAVTQR